MKTLIVLLIWATPAWAVQQDHTCQGGHNCNDGVEVIDLNQDQLQSQIAKQEQEQKQQQETFVEGSSLNNRVSFDSERSAASAFAPTVFPTSPCLVCASGGASTAVVGLSFGGCKIDLKCEERETIRLAPSAEHKLFMWCHQELAVDRFGNVEDCIAHGPRVQTQSLILAQVSDEAFEEMRRHQESQDAQIQNLLDRLEAASKKTEAVDKRMRSSAAKKAREDKEYLEQIQAISQKEYYDE